MNKLLLISGILIVLITVPATSATKCIKQYNSNELKCADTESVLSSPMYSVNWTAICTIDGVIESGIISSGERLSFSGVSFMGAYNKSLYTIDEAPSRDEDGPTGYKYCWCKMLTPAISKWVSTGNTSAGGYSAEFGQCNRICSLLFATDATFRSTMLGTIGQ